MKSKKTKTNIENNVLVQVTNNDIKDGTIVMPDSVEYTIDDLEEHRIVLPDSVEYIEDNAFCDCTSFEKIVIPTYTR